MEVRDAIFYESHWGKCLDLLIHLCYHGDKAILVFGPAGIGKTTMLQALQLREGLNFAFLLLHANDLLHEHVMHDWISAARTSYEQRLLVLLIDDADRLSSQMLNKVLKLQQRVGERPIQVVLCARAVPVEHVSMMRQIELEALNLDELQRFVADKVRLGAIKWEFDRVKLKEILLTTGGIPAEVENMLGKISDRDDDSKKPVMGLSTIAIGTGVTLGVVFCALALLWPDSAPQMTSEEVDLGVISSQVQSDNPSLPIAQFAEHSKNFGTATEETASKDLALATPVEGIVESAADLDVVASTPANFDQVVDKPTHRDEQVTQLEHKLLALQQELRTERELRKQAEQKLARSSTLAMTTKSAVADKYMRGEQKMLQTAGRRFGIQLLGASSEKQVKEFVRRHNFGDKCSYYRTVHNGKPWYVLIYGNFASKPEAQAAIARLPLGVRQIKPWVREYADIHKSIKRSRG